MWPSGSIMNSPDLECEHSSLLESYAIAIGEQLLIFPRTKTPSSLESSSPGTAATYQEMGIIYRHVQEG
jgi:hypothetical protein